MSDHATALTTGLPGLDQVLKGILPGDNIVWQVDTIGDYLAHGRALSARPGCNPGERSSTSALPAILRSSAPTAG